MGIEPHFWTDDIKAAVRFYREALGFEVAQRNPDNDDFTWVQLRRGDVTVMFAGPPSVKQMQQHPSQEFLADVAERMGRGGPVSLYLQVDDVDAAHAQAQAAGATILEPLWDAWWGSRQFTLTDPESNWWTVWSQSKPATG